MEILLPGPHTDFRITQLAHAPDVAPMLEAGVRIHRFQPTMMHAKIILVDSAVALVGSPNLNHRSMQQDDEACAVISDPEIVAILEDQWARDIERSESADLDRWDDRPWWRRVIERLARLVQPQL